MTIRFNTSTATSTTAGNQDPPAYAELYLSVDSMATLPAGGRVANYDTAGISLNTTPDITDDSVIIDLVGTYEIRVDWSANVDQRIIYDVYVRVNDVNVRKVARVGVRFETQNITNGSAAALLALNPGDKIQIFIIPDLGDQAFNVLEGSRLSVFKV